MFFLYNLKKLAGEYFYYYSTDSRMTINLLVFSLKTYYNYEYGPK